jgi:ABC-type oligopeptide transport system substrate-binding subunit
MQPSANTTFTANLKDLVYRDELAEHFRAAQATDSEVRLSPRQDRHEDPAALAALVSSPDLVSATVEDGAVVARFRTRDAAAQVALDGHFLLNGSFRVEESSDQRLVLVRHDGAPGTDRIEVSNVPSSEEEWRRLISGEFDIMTSVYPDSAIYLRQVPGLKIVRYEQANAATVWFAMDRGPMQDANLRRAVAAAIRKAPLAASVTGAPTDAFTDDGGVAVAREGLRAAGYVPERPLRLHVLVHEAQTILVRTAQVLQQQLGNLGIELEIDALPEGLYIEHLLAHEFDLLLFPGDNGEHSWHNLLRTPQGNINGYASDEFETAVAARDEARVRSILARDLPFTPLFDLGESVAISRDLCNVHPKVSYDLTWLGNLRHCNPGEEN